MPNPNPRTDHPAFIAAQFPKAGTERMARANIQVRLPESLDAIVRQLPNRSEWIRKAITEAARKEGLLKGDES
ncbi:MAG: hypothetical protein WCD18_08910 [Thermosynechococcaceae cyanobacterium]